LESSTSAPWGGMGSASWYPDRPAGDRETLVSHGGMTSLISMCAELGYGFLAVAPDVIESRSGATVGLVVPPLIAVFKASSHAQVGRHEED
jgi:hypothetical protein